MVKLFDWFKQIDLERFAPWIVLGSTCVLGCILFISYATKNPYLQKSPYALPAKNSIIPTKQAQPTLQITSKTYTVAQVAKHTTKDDCWVSIADKVYNISSVAQNPLGAKFVSDCGKDNTASYQQVLGNYKQYASIIQSTLDKLYIGTLQ